MIKITIYKTSTRKEPFTKWLHTLDNRVQTILLTRIGRVRLGNFGDCKYITGSNGIWELRVDYGPGYRVYFGKERTTIIVLLIGGEKRSQNRDIVKAKKHWLEYKESSHD